MRKMMLSENQTKIIFDKLSIFKSLDEKGEYKDEKAKVTIKKWEDDDITSNMFILKIDGDYPFLGVVNGMFEREGFGVNTYANGDTYFGYFSEDERNKHGIYLYKPKFDNKYKISEYYYGLWKDNYKYDNGIYLWLKENKNIKPFSDFENSNFTAFIGNIEQDNFTKGTLLIKNANNYYVYHGSFNKNGKKEGDLCFFYSAKKELLLYGTFENDNFISGHMATFSNDGNILKLLKYVKGRFVDKKDINQLEMEIVEKILFNFRNVIMAKDYFGDLYKEFGHVIDFRDKNMNNLEILNSDKYIDIMNAAIGYNKITIFNDIERYVES
jgi:hypothetical protein